MSRKIEARWFIDDNCIHVNSATFYGETLDEAVSEAINKLKETLYRLDTNKIFADFYDECGICINNTAIKPLVINRLHERIIMQKQ